MPKKKQDAATDDLFGYKAEPAKPYGGKAPFQKHSATSKAAAKSIEQKIGPSHKRILDYLDVHCDGETDEGLMTALDLGGNTLRPRRRELQLMDRIADSGRTAKTRSGRDAVVWIKIPMKGESK